MKPLVFSIFIIYECFVEGFALCKSKSNQQALIGLAWKHCVAMVTKLVLLTSNTVDRAVDFAN